MPTSSQALLGLYILASVRKRVQLVRIHLLVLFCLLCSAQCALILAQGLQVAVEVGVVPRLVVAEDPGVMTEESAAVNLATPAMTTERMLMQRIVSK